MSLNVIYFRVLSVLCMTAPIPIAKGEGATVDSEWLSTRTSFQLEYEFVDTSVP